jgi:hypothetical protein
VLQKILTSKMNITINVSFHVTNIQTLMLPTWYRLLVSRYRANRALCVRAPVGCTAPRAPRKWQGVGAIITVCKTELERENNTQRERERDRDDIYIYVCVCVCVCACVCVNLCRFM